MAHKQAETLSITENASGLSVMKILFVENHRVFANLTAKRLLSTHTVTIVPSLACARNTLMTERFDIILIDYDLDDGKGIDLISELKDLPDRPKMIAISSHDFGNSALQNAGADAVCSKQNIQNIESVISRIS